MIVVAPSLPIGYLNIVNNTTSGHGENFEPKRSVQRADLATTFQQWLPMLLLRAEKVTRHGNHL